MRYERLEVKGQPPEFEGVEVVGHEGIDRNGHVNNAYYLVLFERQRAGMMEAFGIDLERTREQFGVSFMVTTALINYRRQLFEGESLRMYTAVENEVSYLRFAQRMVREEVVVADFRCIVAAVNAKGYPQRIPQELGRMIDEGNARLLGKK